MTNAKPRWMTNPQTEHEWDLYITRLAPHLPHCYYLATHYPADQPKCPCAQVS